MPYSEGQNCLLLTSVCSISNAIHDWWHLIISINLFSVGPCSGSPLECFKDYFSVALKEFQECSYI